MENLDPSSHSEAFTRCSETLSASIIQRIGVANKVGSSYDAQATRPPQPQRWQGQASAQGGEEKRGVVGEGGGDVVPKPLLTVPLNINGIETTLKMYEGSGAEGVAYEFCHQEEFAFEGPSLNSCYSQVGEHMRFDKGSTLWLFFPDRQGCSTNTNAISVSQRIRYIYKYQ